MNFIDDYDAVKVGEGLRAFFEAQQEWSYKTFGPRHFRGPRGPLEHLLKEITLEVIPDPYNLEEYADLVFLVFDAVHRAGFTYPELKRALWAKLEKNKRRSWPEWRGTDPNAPVEHDRSKD